MNDRLAAYCPLEEARWAADIREPNPYVPNGTAYLDSRFGFRTVTPVDRKKTEQRFAQIMSAYMSIKRRMQVEKKINSDPKLNKNISNMLQCQTLAKMLNKHGVTVPT